MADNKKEEVSKDANELSKIEAVKELIFGHDIRTFEKEFKEIQDHLEDLELRLTDESNARESAIQDLEKQMEKRMDSMEANIMKRLDKLQDEKTDRATLGKMLVQIGNKLQG